MELEFHAIYIYIYIYIYFKFDRPIPIAAFKEPYIGVLNGTQAP